MHKHRQALFKRFRCFYFIMIKPKVLSWKYSYLLLIPWTDILSRPVDGYFSSSYEWVSTLETSKLIIYEKQFMKMDMGKTLTDGCESILRTNSLFRNKRKILRDLNFIVVQQIFGLAFWKIICNKHRNVSYSKLNAWEITIDNIFWTFIRYRV